MMQVNLSEFQEEIQKKNDLNTDGQKSSVKSLSERRICIVGAGLAGCEAALRLAEKGYLVDLWEMRPLRTSPAHKTDKLGELVCSNSFGSMAEFSPPGLLKKEARLMGSHILRLAEANAVPAGQALGIDREKFSEAITAAIKNNPNIRLIERVAQNLDEIPRPCIIATGPLTDEELANSLKLHLGATDLYFFDAIAPVIDADSINRDIVWAADRYGKSSPDYLNCPLDKDQYLNLIEEIAKARKIEPKFFETTPFFEGCMPIETMVDRGPQTLRFGPLKPVGLEDPRTGRRPYAVVQLRAENRELTSYNMVGFQTRMAYGEQARVFRMIPGLENAEFNKLGSIHRNLYFNSPRSLNPNLSSKKDPLLFFAGQITGVEGYFESTCIGLLVADFLDQKLMMNEFKAPSRNTAMGSLWYSLVDSDRGRHFQPTNINWGLFPKLEPDEKDKGLKKQKIVARAENYFSSLF